MARVEPEELSDPERIFIASSLRVAQAVEESLTRAGVEYAVQVEPFARSLLFGSLRMGAAFYVASGHAVRCRQQLTADGFAGGVVQAQD